MKVGIDIEEISRFRLRRSHPFIKHTFTKKEIDYAFSKPEPQKHLCGIFCAKEALRKAGSFSMSLMKEIEITHMKGAPKALLHATSKNKKGKDSHKNLLHAELSISHAKEYAVGIAIIKDGALQ